MPEQAEHIPYKQVAKALGLGWAWFRLRTKGTDVPSYIPIYPTSLGERVYDSDYQRWTFTFTAEDEQGNKYELTVQNEGRPRSHRDMYGDAVRARTEYTVTLKAPPMRRVRAEPS